MTFKDDLLPLLDTADTEQWDVDRVEGELGQAKATEEKERAELAAAEVVTAEKNATLTTEKIEYVEALRAIKTATEQEIARVTG